MLNYIQNLFSGSKKTIATDVITSHIDKDFKAYIKKVTAHEIHIRRSVTTHFHGDFNSVFKGSGLDFDEVRTYQYGDEIRHINWKVSAKGNGVFTNTFKEEKEQNVFFVIDVSGSQQIGKKDHLKLDVAKEIIGVLALSAVKENSTIGLCAFSDQKEKYVKLKKGPAHAYEIMRHIYYLVPQSTKTNIEQSINFIAAILKRKSIIIYISDFIDEGQYEKKLKALTRKHDLIVIHTASEQEKCFPKLGIVPVYDQEIQKVLLRNTSSNRFQKSINRFYDATHDKIKNICAKYQASYLYINTNNTEENYVSKKLIELFNLRKKY